MTMQRSQNRLREHGDHWKVVKALQNVITLGGRPGILLSCNPDNRPHDEVECTWIGWIPLADAKTLGIVPGCFQPKS